MFAGVRALGQRLTALPFGPSRPGCAVGPTFWLADQAATAMPHRSAAWIVLEERLREAAEFGRRNADDAAALGPGRVCDALERYATTLAAG